MTLLTKNAEIPASKSKSKLIIFLKFVYSFACNYSHLCMFVVGRAPRKLFPMSVNCYIYQSSVNFYFS